VTDDRATRLAALQARLGYAFRDPALLEEALTHRSWTETHPGRPDNERLEFLGDAVLQLVVSHALFAALPGAREGDLSRLRRLVVAGGAETEAGRRWDLGPCLHLGRGEARDGGRDKARILEDAFEAVVGAVYLDGGLEAARALVAPLVDGVLAAGPPLVDPHPKTRLMERVQALGHAEPRYQVLQRDGPVHRSAFRVAVLVDGETWGEGTGGSRREAERAAALGALARLDGGT